MENSPYLVFLGYFVLILFLLFRTIFKIKGVSQKNSMQSIFPLIFGENFDNDVKYPILEKMEINFYAKLYKISNKKLLFDYYLEIFVCKNLIVFRGLQEKAIILKDFSKLSFGKNNMLIVNDGMYPLQLHLKHKDYERLKDFINKSE